MELNALLDQLRALLPNCGVDTSEELRILEESGKQTDKPVLLVVGDEPGRPTDLIEGLGLKPFPLPKCPVEFSYGEHLSVTVWDQTGEIHHFQDVSSYQTMGPAAPQRLTVFWNSPVLQIADLRFLQAETVGETDLSSQVGDCAGCLLVLNANAGAPAPAMTQVCDWLGRLPGIGGRMKLVLNHAENTFPNYALEWGLPVDVAETVTCDYQSLPGGEDGPEVVLLTAAKQLPPGKQAADREQVAKACAKAVAERLLRRAETLEAQAKSSTKNADWFANTAKSYRAKMGMTHAALRLTLTPEEKEIYSRDLRDMISAFSNALPEMSQELLQARPDTAKEDVANLAASYVEAVCGAYLQHLCGKIMNEKLRPQAESAFQEAINSFRQLIEDAPIRLEEWRTEDGTLLKSVQLNMSDYVDPLTNIALVAMQKGLGFSVAILMQILNLGNLSYTAKVFVEQVFGVFTWPLREKIGKLIQSISSAESFVKKFVKALRKYLTDLPDQMFKTLDETILPMLTADAEDQFKTMADQQYQLLLTQCIVLSRDADSMTKDAEAARNNAAALQELAA